MVKNRKLIALLFRNKQLWISIIFMSKQQTPQGTSRYGNNAVVSANHAGQQFTCNVRTEHKWVCIVFQAANTLHVKKKRKLLAASKWASLVPHYVIKFCDAISYLPFYLWQIKTSVLQSSLKSGRWWPY